MREMLVRRWWLFALRGGFAILFGLLALIWPGLTLVALAGLVALFWPGITALVLLVVIAVWAIVGGVLEIVTAVRLRKVIEHERFLALSGLLSVVLGIILLSTPSTGALALVVTIGAFAILWGIVLVLLSLRLRKFASTAA
jgi:uncharacterized membrane protein HdeD (DUF308 family)